MSLYLTSRCRADMRLGLRASDVGTHQVSFTIHTPYRHLFPFLFPRISAEMLCYYPDGFTIAPLQIP